MFRSESVSILCYEKKLAPVIVQPLDLGQGSDFSSISSNTNTGARSILQLSNKNMFLIGKQKIEVFVPCRIRQYWTVTHFITIVKNLVKRIFLLVSL